jgi:hypothetical protein
MENKVSLGALASLDYLDPKKARFYVKNENFLCLDYEGQTYENIKLHRALPHSLPDDYISVQDIESKELFFIRSLYEFPKEQANLLARELAKRYYCPKIFGISSLIPKLGYLYFTVQTDSGEKSFVLRDATRNIVRISDGARILIMDVDGNRYQIDDVARLPHADFKKLEPYLL